jgi:hypothetical protein
MRMPRNNKSYRNNKNTVKHSEEVFEIGLLCSKCLKRISLKKPRLKFCIEIDIHFTVILCHINFALNDLFHDPTTSKVFSDSDTFMNTRQHVFLQAQM